MGLGLKVKRAVFKLIRIVVRPFYGRNIWIISDRINQAGDNGEAFFKYLQDKDVKSVFAIRKDSPDYPRLRSIGKVVEYDSKLHKLLLCVADCNCSAYLIHMENHVETPQIFLQHGVSEKDISKYINPASHKNFYIITSAYQEKRQMMGDNYKVAPEHIWLTGLARFDYLRNEPKKLVVFAFTWRSAFMDYSDEEIASSEYFKTLKRIMSDSTFCEKLSLMGYKLAIMPHPKVREYVHLLPQSKSCEIYAGSYNKMYSEAELIVTDYSSAIFDFAYLRKSIIYYQFDGDEYYQNNPFIKKGFFDYEKDGFGPVVTQYEDLQEKIICMIRQGCIIDEKYRERADSFFAYRDKSNCKRIYDHIKELTNEHN